MANESQRMMYEARVYGEQLRLLENEINRISMTAAELESSLRTIEALKDDDVFVPIGGGAVVKGRVTSSDVLVPIGGGYLVGLKKHEAVEEVKKRIKSTESAVGKLKTEFEKINAKLRDVGSRLDAMDAANPKGRGT